MGQNVMGLFEYEDEFITAAERLKGAGYDDLTLMSPIPLHDADKVLGLAKSPVRRFSLAGALIGAVSGFSLATFSALSFIQPTGGRAIIAFPPFLVITYELTILFGVLATLLGFHYVSGLPAWRDKIYTPKAIVDRFTLVVGVAEGRAGDAERIIREAGADEVRQVEGEA